MPPRTPFVAGNWKMNLSRESSVALARDIAIELGAARPAADVAVCPPFVYLDAVGHALRGTDAPIALGAQDVHPEPHGAFTGEISTGMLADLGVRYVIVGHSERRHVLHEPDELVRAKAHAVLNSRLECILCIGETLEQRRAGQTDAVNERQLRSALTGLSPEFLPRLTIAYEPIWAIGTGQTASPADAQNAHAQIRSVLASLFSHTAAERLRIQYGGSVKADNARELFQQPDIDGGLIGGASLKAADFVAIVRAV